MVNAKIGILDQDIETGVSTSFIYAFSPTVRIEECETGYLITITDKNGTTSALIPVVTESSINTIISQYFESSQIIQNYIQEHDESETAHEDIRTLIESAINSIPHKTSDLENDAGYVTNVHEMIVSYPSFLNFPENPSEEEKNSIFLDASTGDLYVYGLNETSTYSSISVANNTIISGGDSTSYNN